jgi:2-polyprenyl-6-hydroxyphenyl methylase / 3-demethylubiquinone-9 3-methyltransferase
MQNNHNKTEKFTSNTVDDDEIAKFSAMADAWWDVHGAFKPLHDITPLRVGYVRDQVCEHFLRDPTATLPLQGLKLLDIGCGGGLASEPMCRLGANVTGVDASSKNISIAKHHAEQSGLDITYRATNAETLVGEGVQFDVVLALEIIEHVADVQAFLRAVTALTREGGIIVITTLNRTLKSLLMAKIGAEYVMRWLPIGTHDWNKFLRPSEIALPMRDMGCEQRDLTGMIYHPLKRTWSLSEDDVSVNYLQCFTRNDKVLK